MENNYQIPNKTNHPLLHSRIFDPKLAPKTILETVNKKIR